MPAKILVLSAYDALSHRRWRQQLVKNFPKHSWTVLSLAPRHFSWRIRGNSLTWAFSETAILNRSYDLVIATSMTDLSTLRGLVPSLGVIPTLVYFHENQFAYPQREKNHERVEPKMVTLYTALVADRILFNSEFNRESFLEGVDVLLNKMPDGVPKGIVKNLLKRSEILPVPLENYWFDKTKKNKKTEPLTLLWNHRWEHDKAPDRLYAALLALKEKEIDFRIHIIGQQFQKRPSVFEDMRIRLQAHIGEWGTIEDPAHYRSLLSGSHVVISTALHDFQGLAILEAVASGCIPLVPDRLAYRDFIDEQFRYPSSPERPELEAEDLCKRLIELERQYQRGDLPSPPDLSYLSWQHLGPRYGAVLNGLMNKAYIN